MKKPALHLFTFVVLAVLALFASSCSSATTAGLATATPVTSNSSVDITQAAPTAPTAPAATNTAQPSGNDQAPAPTDTAASDTAILPATDTPEDTGSADAATPEASATAPEAPTADTSGGGPNDSGAAAEIARALRALTKVQSYRATVTIGLGDSNIVYNTTYLAPDRSTMVQPGKSNSQMISIGDTLYYQDKDGSWKTMKSDAGGMSGRGQLLYGQMLDELIAGITDAHAAGQEDVNGTPTQVYEFKDTWHMAALQANSVDKLWVATSDGLPRRFDMQNTVSQEGDSLTTTASDVFLTFNDPTIKIEPPTTGK